MTDNTNLNEQLPVLIVDETEDQGDIGMKYFDQDRFSKERTGNDIDSQNKKMPPPTLKKPVAAQANDRTCTLTELTIKLPKAMPLFTINATQFKFHR